MPILTFRAALTLLLVALVCIPAAPTPARADITFAGRNKLSTQVIIKGKIANTTYKIYQSVSDGGGGGYVYTGINITTGPGNGSPTGEGTVTVRHAEGLMPGRHLRTGEITTNHPNDQQPNGVAILDATYLPNASYVPGFNPPQPIVLRQAETPGSDVFLETWNPGAVYSIGLDPAQASWVNMGCQVQGQGDLQVQLLQCLPQQIIFQVMNDPTMNPPNNVTITGVGVQVNAAPCSFVQFKLGLQGTSNVFLNGQFQTQINNQPPADYVRIPVAGGPPPNLSGQPQGVRTCPGGTASLTVATAPGTPASTFRWQIESAPTGSNIWTNLSDGPVQHGGVISGTGMGAASNQYIYQHNQTDLEFIRFRCIATNGCGSTPSNPATLTICPADLNCDGLLNSGDYLDFLLAFAGGEPVADRDGSGDIDSGDFLAYLLEFADGCV